MAVMTWTPPLPAGGVPQPAAPPPPAASGQLAPTASGWNVDYPVFFVPELAQAKVVAARRNRTSRIISLAISIAIVVALYAFFAKELGTLTWPIVVISVGLPLGYLAWAIVKEVVRRREASGVGPGLALGIGRAGLLLHTGWLPWHEVGALKCVSRRLGRSDDLKVIARDGATVALPLAYLSAKPATVDGAVKALSGGRCRLDFSRLDA